jgi:hypothetical protein
MSVAFLCAGGVVLIGAVAYWNRKTSRRQRAVFRQRPEMIVEDMHRSFYAGSAVSIESLRGAMDEISGVLGVPPTRLRPSDRFAVELAPEPGWEYDDPLGVLTALAEEKLKREGRAPDSAKDLLTVDDYVRLTSRSAGVPPEA